MLHLSTPVGVRGPARAKVAMVDGRPRAIAWPTPDGDALGELLVATGALESLPASARGTGPFGARLVEAGIVSAGELRVALAAQLEQRLLRVFGWPSADYRFRPGRPDVGVPHLDAPLGVADLVVGAMRGAVANVSVSEIHRQLCAGRSEGTWELTRLGATLLSELDQEVRPRERALVSILRAGVADLDALLSAAAGDAGALRLVYALTLLRGLDRGGPESYGLLLRKHRQLKRRPSPRALLDLPPGAPPEAGRAALRRLARSLHPDRFAASAAASVRRMSADVLRELVVAEETLRSERGVVGR